MTLIADHKSILACALVATSLCAAQALANAVPPFTAPQTEARPVVNSVHGIALTDPYRWLEDKSAQDVKTWTRTQHEATMAWLDRAAPAIPSLRDDLARYVDRTITSAPRYYKGQEFFTRKRKGEAQAKLYTRVNGQEVLLFDPVALDPSGKTSLSSFQFSRHGNLMAIATQTAGAEITDTHFLDRTTGKALYPTLPGTSGVSFGAAPGVIYFTPRTKALIDAQKPLDAYMHTLGTPITQAKRVLANDDAKNSVDVFEAERAAFTVYERGDFWSRTYTIAASGSSAEPTLLFSSKKARAEPIFVGQTAYLRTNDGAPNWKLLRADLRDLHAIRSETIIAERPDVQLVDADITNTHIVAVEKRNLMKEIALYDLNGRPDAKMPKLIPPELGDVAGVSFDHHSNQLYVSLTTFNSPATLYRVDPVSFQWTKVFQDESAIDTQEIVTTRIDVPTRDGKRVPAFISMKKGTALDGKRPVVLYGYGGFNIGIRVRHLGAFAALINRGVILVEAGIRGGDEFGEAWHTDGMLAHKQNTFNDFIDTAQWLIANQYTNPDKLAIFGGSNGGLLVGAVATQRPDLFKAVVCSVPLLDMVRFPKFLIARYWIPEYGDPEKDADFRTLLSYSPYHAIRNGVSLPTMLVIAGENDSRVDPLHAKKFVARAQANIGQTNPVLLKMDFDAGHGTGKSTAQLIEDREVWMRFLLAMIGDR